MESNKQYDLIVLGPTGYTGRFCADHIVKNFPTNLKWALAGRSLSKLENIAKELKNVNPDRADPDLLPVQLHREELHPLVQKTRVIINCVGPYCLYSTPVIEACASNGTHYVDATGETHWVKEIISEYHETAKANGAVIIPCVGIESAPADLLAWATVKRVREDLSCHTRSITGDIHEIKSSGASGGTLSTVLTFFENVPPSEMRKISTPFALAAAPPPKDIPREPLWTRLLGIRSVRDLGILTTSPSGLADITTVHRSSTLMPEFYGPRFYFRQFLRARNAFTGILWHYAFLFAVTALLLPPIRTLVRKYIYTPGTGPTLEDSVNDFVEYRAVATADQDTAKPQRVLGKLRYQGTMYEFTGLSLAEAAMTIIENEEKVKKVSRCGIVTTATLGQEFIDRWDKVGCHIETQVVDN